MKCCLTICLVLYCCFPEKTCGLIQMQPSRENKYYIRNPGIIIIIMLLYHSALSVFAALSALSAEGLSNVSKLQWVGNFHPLQKKRQLSFWKPEIWAAGPNNHQIINTDQQALVCHFVLGECRDHTWYHLKVRITVGLTFFFYLSEFESLAARFVTFSMSRWSCWVTCQHGSPRTAVMLCRSPPVRQETLLLANVSFICTEWKCQQEHQTIRPERLF